MARHAGDRTKIDEDYRGVGVTDAGYAAAGAPTAGPTDAASTLDLWCRRLRRDEELLLRAVVEVGPAGLSRHDLASTADYAPSGGTLNTYLGVLRRNGLIAQHGDVMVPTDVLRS